MKYDPRPPADDELPALACHVKYERTMLHLTAWWLQEERAAANVGGPDADLHSSKANAFVESFLVHARNLVEFFQCKIDKESGVRVGDGVFASDFGKWNPGTHLLKKPAEAVRLINKRAQHITAYRVRISKADEISDVAIIVDQLESVWLLFLKGLERDRRAWFDEAG